MAPRSPDSRPSRFPVRGPASRSRAVVGGFPWEASLPRQSPVAIDVGPPRPARAPAALSDVSWRWIRRRCEAYLAESPALTVSLVAHLILLLLLAVIGIRERAAQRLRLEVSFGAPREPPGGVEQAAEQEALPAVVIKSEIVRAEPPMPAKPLAERAAAVPPPLADTRAAVAAEPPGPPAATAPAAIGALLSGRGAEARQRLLGAGGGTAETETAVSRALEWLVRQQRKDGLWSLMGPYADGSRQENRLAASALALLALQGAGNSPHAGEHRQAVARAWTALLGTQQADGTFDTGTILEQHRMYAHGQITIALCEVFGMTKDPRFAEPATRALAYAVAAQMPDGGWRYQPPRAGGENRGDMSVTGWFLMALKSGEMAGLAVPAETYVGLGGFLDAVFVSPEKGYGYQINPGQKVFDFRPALTAEALLCRQFLGWRRDDPRLAAGVELLVREAPLDLDYRRKNVYAWYYQTQVCHHHGGAPWAEWNRLMQERLVPAQVAGGREEGSWDPANDQWGHVGGRLYVTSLCTCMLEVYYRHGPWSGEP